MILRGHDAFGDVLRHGSLVHGRWIRCFVRITQEQHDDGATTCEAGSRPDKRAPVLQVGFAAPKKIASSAVLRNRIKRLMREAVRLEKEPLWSGLERQEKKAVVVVMLRRQDPSLLKSLALDDIAGDWRSMVPKILSLC